MFLPALLLVAPPAGEDATPEMLSPRCLSVVQEAASGFALPAVGALPTRPLPADAVVCEAEEGNLREVILTESGPSIAVLSTGEKLEFLPPQSAGAWFTARLAGLGVEVSAALRAEVPKKEGRTASKSGPSIAGWLVTGFVVVFAFVLFRRWRANRRATVKVGSSTSSPFGSRSGSDRDDQVPTTRFSDVAGAREAIEDLQEMVEVLRHPERFKALGARTPRGALLVGPPGTGKTLLARAVAGEAGVPFYPVAGSDFVEIYVGNGAKRVREVFAKAKKQGRAIIFIDEIDAVGRRRSSGEVSGGEQEHENTLIALLNELDGFSGSDVMVLAATNRPEILDPALTRPGRLDRRVHVGLPDLRERAEILGVHARGKPFADDVDLDRLAARTPGLSGAQLEQVCNEAALLAARGGRARIEHADLNGALEYVTLGRARRSATVDPEERRVTAWHEAGHTVAALLEPGADPPVAVSVVPRGSFGGVTWMQSSDSRLPTRQTLFARLVVALGGRAAEEILLAGEMTAGAANDLQQAGEIARAMVEDLGMTERGFPVSRGDESSLLAAEELLRDAMNRARSLLLENRALLQAFAEELIEREDLDADAIERVAAPFLPAGS